MNGRNLTPWRIVDASGETRIQAPTEFELTLALIEAKTTRTIAAGAYGLTGPNSRTEFVVNY